MSNDGKILNLLLNIQRDISELKTDVSNMKTDISNIKTDISNMKTDIEGLNANQIVIENRLDSIQEQTTFLVEFPTETNEKLQFITDKTNDIEAVTKENLYDITKLKLAR